MLIIAPMALIKQLKIKWKDKISIKKDTFQVSKNRIHNFQDTISFYNSLTSVSRLPVSITLIFIRLKFKWNPWGDFLQFFSSDKS